MYINKKGINQPTLGKWAKSSREIRREEIVLADRSKPKQAFKRGKTCVLTSSPILQALREERKGKERKLGFNGTPTQGSVIWCQLGLNDLLRKRTRRKEGKKAEKKEDKKKGEKKAGKKGERKDDKKEDKKKGKKERGKKASKPTVGLHNEPDTTECMFCNGTFSESRTGEQWIQCKLNRDIGTLIKASMSVEDIQKAISHLLPSTKYDQCSKCDVQILHISCYLRKWMQPRVQPKLGEPASMDTIQHCTGCTKRSAQGKFVNAPFVAWSKKTSECSEWMKMMEEFVRIYEDPQSCVPQLGALLLCGRQCIAIRGDNEKLASPAEDEHAPETMTPILNGRVDLLTKTDFTENDSIAGTYHQHGNHWTGLFFSRIFKAVPSLLPLMKGGLYLSNCLFDESGFELPRTMVGIGEKLRTNRRLFAIQNSQKTMIPRDKPEDDPSCGICHATFERKLFKRNSRGWNRYGAHLVGIRAGTAECRGRFICYKCFQKKKKEIKANPHAIHSKAATPHKGSKRCHTISTPVKRFKVSAASLSGLPHSSLSPAYAHTAHVKGARAVSSAAIRTSRYGKALKTMMSSSKARKAFDKMLTLQLRAKNLLPHSECFLCDDVDEWCKPKNYKLGLTRSAPTARAKIDSLREEAKDRAKEWVSTELTPSPQGERTARRSLWIEDSSEWVDIVVEEVDVEDSAMEEAVQEVLEGEEVEGSATEEAVQEVGEVAETALVEKSAKVKVKARHETLKRQSQMKLWGMIYIALNRIPRPLSSQPANILRAEAVGLDSVLPDRTCWEGFKEMAVVEVEQILQFHLRFLNKTTAASHSPHRFSKQAAQKSQIFYFVYYPRLGFMLDISLFLPFDKSFVIISLSWLPGIDGERVVPQICYGDGLSVERMVDAKRARAQDPTPMERLEGFIPCPQDFHRRGLLMQDTFNELLKGQSSTERGTLYQLKQLYQQRQVSGRVMHCFNHAQDFIQFVTDGYSLLLAAELAGLKSLDAPPDGASCHKT
ncbi:hypothetical protein CAPTEDRAFT_186660 [Capitella teleta]|uniref:DUF6589 domain-containing protein n=1 Tax=Capitella teleta TaxID=283909 RepID=R7TWX8_CAPTE|nr:hypothetical protein CAPTEDRAFT_186660 [Capitella teleta]|eukprot:ELT95941.1 hypothetical protein CAPTEDRAFT_186660 [Capitella teleta]